MRDLLYAARMIKQIARLNHRHWYKVPLSWKPVHFDIAPVRY